MTPTTDEPLRSGSSIVANTTAGYHILKIDGYSFTKATPTGDYLKSRPFTLGGHRWFIRYYPNGNTSEFKDYILIFLNLEGIVGIEVKARYQLRLGDKVGQQALTLLEVSTFTSPRGWGYPKFVKREELEKSTHLKGDSFTVRCDIVIVNEFRTEEATAVDAPPRFVSVPPSSLHQHLGDILLAEKGADVVFDVGGQTFAAHRCVLAARSPVFSAELFGTMKESNTAGVIHVDDMEPQVFKALLYFVYTDSLPKTKNAEDEDEDEDEEEDVVSQHLLVAADRYNLERLKLAQHHCEGLKKACFHFLNTPANLRTAMATDGFKHLSRSCPTINCFSIVNSWFLDFLVAWPSLLQTLRV
ncbi:hypothetical protein GQ55_9G245200 [Panicum hallii var. hallii]|uniref:BTB domain-containing protein n=1 Tax=Panicum hallii var. hallii TaxID=1504633 RepID=A0A2T7C6P8_9POAL|nr:hypothetical protein GQ55_9G245200 [Panicum hallii var. hallii]